jgi:predicted secreted protein
MLAQCVMAEGVAKVHPAMVRPVVEFCLNNDINIVQMPCPETNCAAGGLGREPRGKVWYERNGLRDTCIEIAAGQLDYMQRLLAANIEILAIIGIDFSPACAVTYLNKGRSIVRDEGIYIEELKKGMAARGFSVPFIGVAAKWERRIERDLRALLRPAEPEIPGLTQVGQYVA